MYKTMAGTKETIRKEITITQPILVKALDMKIHYFLLAVVANEALAEATTDTSIPSLERRVRQYNVALCSYICGTPPLSDCLSTIQSRYPTANSLNKDEGVCLHSGSLSTSIVDRLPNNNCQISLNPPAPNLDGLPYCVSAHDFENVTSHLAGVCPGRAGLGGCYVFSDGGSLCLLDMASTDSCNPVTLS